MKDGQQSQQKTLRLGNSILQAHFILNDKKDEKKAKIVVVPTEREAATLARHLRTWSTILKQDHVALTFPDTPTKQQHLAQILFQGTKTILCVTEEQLLQDVATRGNDLTFSTSTHTTPQQIDIALDEAGYTKEPMARAVGSYARHGDAITIVLPNGRVRIDILGTTIEAIIANGKPVPSVTLPSQQLGSTTTSLFKLLQHTAPELYSIEATPVAFQNKPYTLLTIATDAPAAYTSQERTTLEATFTKQQRQPQHTTAKPPAIDYAFLETLKDGDLIVHTDHGIGTFRGIETTHIDAIEKEFFVIEYAQEDRLLVPLTYAGKLSKYIGAVNPTIHRIGGALWNTTRRKVQKATEDIAKELVALYAKRATAQGFSYTEDSEAMIEFEAAFPYIETADQQRAIEDIKRDMENDQPVDRLICGDVGFGKTEVAMRAAFKATDDGKQVAVLAPTTILAQQHYASFSKRFAGTKKSIGQLSRFVDKQQQQQTLEQLRTGSMDIAIGTHRLLSKDVRFKNLGLLIIDEEQRFGVKHKEHFKKLRAEIDIVTLSATPIPRTLNMAVSGIRSISNISTPPPGRKPVKVTVVQQKDAVIQEALQREYERQGQAYYVFNSVEKIHAKKRQLEELLNEWGLEMTIGIGHGQLPENELEDIIHRFEQHDVDILLCTTIVQNGIDIPNVNTMIIENAPNFGLTQLYQLKGRVGRSEAQGFAYFLFDSHKLSPVARQRLEAIQETEHLGAGFEIAIRDMEIRGTGNILGSEQSGSVSAVGMALYAHMLEDAIHEIENGTPATIKTDPRVDLPLTTSIPQSFTQNSNEQLAIIERITHAHTIDDLHTRREHLRQEYGTLPVEVENLIHVVEITKRAAEARITTLSSATYEKSGTQHTDILVEFADSLTQETIKTLMTTSPHWTLKPEERSATIALSELGTSWVTALTTLLANLKPA